MDEGQPLQILITATDPDGDNLSFTASGAPAASTLVDNGDGTANFGWTPGFGDAGNVVVRFAVNDDGNPGRQRRRGCHDLGR